MSNDLFDPKDTHAESFVKLVKEEIKEIKKRFFTIGFRLTEANENCYYLELGFKDITECAETLFGFKKTTTYDLMAVYKHFHDPKAKTHILPEYEKLTQSQLVLLTGDICAKDSFIKYVRPEDTVETIKKAKSLWNKIYKSGGSPFYGGNQIYKFETLPEFIEQFLEDYSQGNTKEDWLDALPASQSNDYSVQTENFIETTASDAEPEMPDQNQEDFSGQTEKLGEFCKDSILHFLKIMDFSIGFGGDKKTPGTRVVPDFMSEEVLRALGRAIEKDRTKVKHMLTKYLVDRFGTFEYEITLYGRKQNFAVFCGTLAGSLTDYLIKEFSGKDDKK